MKLKPLVIACACLLVFFAIASPAPQGFPRMGPGVTVGDVVAGFVSSAWDMVLSSGADGSLNGGATFETAPGNLIRWSEDLTEEFTASGATVTATTIEDTASGGTQYVYQNPLPETSVDATEFEILIWFLDDSVAAATRYPRIDITGASNQAAYIDTDTGDTAAQAGITVSSSADGSYWKMSIQEVATDANGLDLKIYPACRSGALAHGACDASLLGTVTISKIQVCPGTCGDYVKTDDKQSIYDYSGNANHAQNGSGPGVTTNDAGNLAAWSYNVSTPGSTDLENTAAWTDIAGVTVVDSDTAIFADSVVCRLHQSAAPLDLLPTGTYRMSATMSVDSGTAPLRFSSYNTTDSYQLSGDITVTTTPTSYNHTVTITGTTDVRFGFREDSGFTGGTFNITNFQIVQVPSGWTSELPFHDPASPTYACTACDFDGVDNYLIVDSITDEVSGTDQPVSIVVLFRDEDLSDTTTLVAWGGADTGKYVLLENLPNNGLRWNRKDDSAVNKKPVVTPTPTEGLWHIAVISDSGTAVSSHFDAALDTTDGDVDVGATTLTKTTIGGWRYGSSAIYMLDGQIGFMSVDFASMTAQERVDATCQIAAMAWDYRAIPVFGADAACSEYDLTSAPQYAHLSPAEMEQKLRGQFVQNLWAALSPGGIQ